MLDLSQAWREFPVLETERLTLRALRPEDAPDHFALWSDPVVMAAHGAPPYTETAQSEDLIRRYARDFSLHEAIRWAVTLRGHDRLIGTCGYHHLSREHHRSEIGYELVPAHWRQGIMAEALRAVLRHGFRDMRLHRIEAVIDPKNNASAGLLRRLGFKYEACLRERFHDNGRFSDDWYFSQLAHEFRG
jgi:ribosomal-protein-alanine N-acetyltransferase